MMLMSGRRSLYKRRQTPIQKRGFVHGAAVAGAHIPLKRKMQQQAKHEDKHGKASLRPRLFVHSAPSGFKPPVRRWSIRLAKSVGHTVTRRSALYSVTSTASIEWEKKRLYFVAPDRTQDIYPQQRRRPKAFLFSPTTGETILVPVFDTLAPVRYFDTVAPVRYFDTLAPARYFDTKPDERV